MAWHGVQYKVELVLVTYKTTLFYDTIVSASVVSFYTQLLFRSPT